MKAIIVNNYGGPEVLELKNVEIPQPKENELLVRIKATSVTAASTFMRAGKPYFGRLFLGLRRPKTRTPGTDLAGIIEAVGSKVTQFKIGDAVLAATGLICGAYAEYICLKEDELIVQKPMNISFEEATGILDGGSTALAFFTDSVQLKKGQKVLINGASGSIGTAAIQLAKNVGADVTAICSGKNKGLVMDLGADSVIDYTTDELKTTTEKFDVIFDTVGKMPYRQGRKRLNSKGVFLTPVLDVSTLANLLFVSPFTSKKLKFAATGMRKHELQMRDLTKIREMLVTGQLVTVIDRVYKLEQVQEAHQYVDKGHKRGNVVISM